MSSPRQRTTRRRFLESSSAAVAGAAVASATAGSDASEQGPTVQPTVAQKTSAVVNGPMMKLAEILPPPVGQVWRLAKQCGADHVVGTWGRAPNLEVSRDKLPWSYDSLARLKEMYEKEGFQLAVLECRPP